MSEQSKTGTLKRPEMTEREFDWWTGYLQACKKLLTWPGFSKRHREVIEEQAFKAMSEIERSGTKWGSHERYEEWKAAHAG